MSATIRELENKIDVWQGRCVVACVVAITSIIATNFYSYGHGEMEVRHEIYVESCRANGGTVIKDSDGSDACIVTTGSGSSAIYSVTR